MPRSFEQKRSLRQEQKTAKEINGRTTPASGSRWHQKGDIRSDKFLIECKTTTKDSYRLTAKTWEKIYKEALRDGIREPVMRIDLCNEFGDIISFAVMQGSSYDKLCSLNLSEYFTFKSQRGWHNFHTVKVSNIVEIRWFVFIGNLVTTVFPWKLFMDYFQKDCGEGSN